ncbi:MAG: low molecular weight protein-tyrosine-phosphatase [Planctomycetota bacterium]|jgi:protein-tyrosine phosphatase
MPVERVLFICMGNICRSPLAEGLFLHKIALRNVSGRFEVDSAGTGGWHAGERADRRMRTVAGSHGITLPSRARQVEAADFAHFHALVCMDEDNRAALLAAGAPSDKISLLLEHDSTTKERNVPDPYYGGTDGFEHVYDLVDSACDALLAGLLPPTR